MNLGIGLALTAVRSNTTQDEGDVTAPALSSATVGSLTIAGGVPAVDTDEDNGTIYMVVVPNGDTPSAAQIKAGQQSSGAAALADESMAVSGTGTQTFAEVTGLTMNTAYDCWFVHTDEADNDSDAVKADFTTSMLTTSMSGWYRKGVGITATGDQVESWADQSGNGNDLLKGSDALRPDLQGDGTILFPGTSLLRDTFTLNQPCTVYIKFKQLTWTSTDRVFDGGAALARLYQTGTEPQLVFSAGSDSSSISLTLDTYGVVQVVMNGASSVLQLDDGTAVTGNFGANNPGGLAIGGGSGGGQLSDIQVSEAVVYAVAHDADTRAAVRAYLNGV